MTLVLKQTRSPNLKSTLCTQALLPNSADLLISRWKAVRWFNSKWIKSNAAELFIKKMLKHLSNQLRSENQTITYWNGISQLSNSKLECIYISRKKNGNNSLTRQNRVSQTGSFLPLHALFLSTRSPTENKVVAEMLTQATLKHIILKAISSKCILGERNPNQNKNITS